MSFSLDRHSGKKCIMLSARALSIAWGSNSLRYRSWNGMPNSRFAEVAELVRVCRLKIRGTINSRMPSRGTHYAAYLIFKSTPTSIGFGFQSVEVGTGFAGDECSIYLRRENIARGHRRIHLFLLPAPFKLVDDNRHGAPLTPAPAKWDGNYFKERRDGWSEIEFDEFLTKDGEDGAVEMSVLEEDILSCKAGLVVEGIEIMSKYGK